MRRRLVYPIFLQEVPTFGSLPDVVCNPPWAITPHIMKMPSHNMTPDMNNAQDKGQASPVSSSK